MERKVMDPNNPRKKQPGQWPSNPSPMSPRGKKEEKCISKEECTKKEKEQVTGSGRDQEEINVVCNKLALTIEEEVLENTKWRITMEECPTEEDVSLRNGGWANESRNISI